MEQTSHPNDTLTARELDIMRELAAGLSNREIADKLVISLGTVKWYNKQIYSKFGVNSRTQAIKHANDLGILNSDNTIEIPTTTPAAPLIHNVPVQLTPLIGRNREISEISNLLQAHRLLTLTGAGGTGKTRLAIAAAEHIAARYPDGVFFCDLAPLTDSGQVMGAIAASLGISERGDEPHIDTLKRALDTRKILLIVDNFEHVIEAASIMPELLAVPNLGILVTSREVLRVSGEQMYVVSPLKLPDDDRVSDLDLLAQNEAVTLFIQRAQSVSRSFQLTTENAPDIVEICRRLDEMPLAIELAAARIRLMPPHTILKRMDERFRILTGSSRDAPERQQTLRATVDWSYDLLDEGEKILFARLAAFRGGRSLEAIEAVCGDDLPIDVFDGLESLLDKSLIRQIKDELGEPRFVMLETIQEYALERLNESDEAPVIRNRHAQYFADFANQIREGAIFDDTVPAKIEHDNLRAALGWTLMGGGVPDVGLDIVAKVNYFWWREGYDIEGRRWVEQAFEHFEDAPADLRGSLLVAASWLAYHRRDLAHALTCSEQALAIFRELGDQVNIGMALVHNAFALRGQPEKLADALANAQEGERIFRDLSLEWRVYYARLCVGNLSRQSGNYVGARAAYEDCIAYARQQNFWLFESVALGNLAGVAFAEGDYQQAEALGKASIAIAWEHRHSVSIVTANLIYFVALLAAQEQPEEAVKLLGAVAAAQNRLGLTLQPAHRHAEDRFINALPEQLDKERFDALFVEGRKMSLEEAVEFVLASPN